MKRIVLFLLLLGLLTTLAAQNKLSEVYYRDYGDIMRLVLVFSQKPDATVTPTPASKSIVITVKQCARATGVQNSYAFASSRVLEGLDISEQGGTLTLTVRTDKAFTLQRPRRGIEPQKIVLDIFNTLSPSTVAERYSFAKFDATVGYLKYATDHFQWLKKNAGAETAYHYDWGMMLLSQGKKKEALEHFRAVDAKAGTYADAQKQIATLGGTAPQQAQPRPAPAQKPAPQPAQQQKPAPQQPAPTQQKPQPAAPAEPAAPQDDLQKVWNDIYTQSPNEETRHFLVAQAMAGKALATKEDADYKLAVAMLEGLGDNTPFKTMQYRTLHDLHLVWGNLEKAKQYVTGDESAAPVSRPPRKSGFMQIRIPFWLALVLAVLVGLIIFFLLMIYYGKKHDGLEPEFTMEDVHEHQGALREMAVDDSTDEELTEDEPEEPYIDDEPPMKEPARQQAYEPELPDEPEIPEEPEPTPRPTLSIPEEPEPPAQNDDSMPSFGDPEYQKKMILKLHNDGWETEAIAKELQISQREVDFILKTNK